MKRTITAVEAADIRCDEDPRFAEVDGGTWVSGGKSETCTIVVREIDTDIHWALKVSRYGSYFSDYSYHEATELVEVERREVIITKWVAK